MITVVMRDDKTIQIIRTDMKLFQSGKQVFFCSSAINQHPGSLIFYVEAVSFGTGT